MPESKLSEPLLEAETPLAYGSLNNEVASGDVENQKESTGFSCRKFWFFAGPGFAMTIAYIDPGNFESDLQAGAYSGLSLMWVLFAVTAFGYIFQVLTAQVAIYSGLSLAQHCRLAYPKPVVIFIWLMTEVAVIGSDIQEVVGSAIGWNVLFGLDLWKGTLLTAVLSILLLNVDTMCGNRSLEILFGGLLGVVCVSMVTMLVTSPVNHRQDMESTITAPFNSGLLVQALGMLGCVIMPYNIHLHSAMMRQSMEGRFANHKLSEINAYSKLESAIGPLTAS
jgi:natural resistance-associated macrophage protein